jgi:hypothetical protein
VKTTTIILCTVLSKGFALWAWLLLRSIWEADGKQRAARRELDALARCYQRDERALRGAFRIRIPVSDQPLPISQSPQNLQPATSTLQP